MTVSWDLPILDIMSMVVAIISLIISLHIFKHARKISENTQKMHEVLTKNISTK